MIVLTGGKADPFSYCLTTAQYCPLPGQYLAIARHETIRREIEKPYSPFYSSLFTDSPEPPINTGGARGEECSTTLHNSSPLFTLFLHLLFRLDAEEFGLSVQNISAEEIRLLQKTLYLVDC